MASQLFAFDSQINTFCYRRMKEFIQEKNHIRVNFAEKVSFKEPGGISIKLDAKCSQQRLMLPLNNQFRNIY